MLDGTLVQVLEETSVGGSTAIVKVNYGSLTTQLLYTSMTV